MGRKRLFCQQQTLRQILCLFWQKGYAHTSIRDIAEALDIPIASLYHCYGDKQAILAAALIDYQDNYLTPMINGLDNADNPIQALYAFFAALAGSTSSTPPTETPPTGCFLVLMADQCQTEAPHLAQQARAILGHLEAAFDRLLARAGIAATDSTAYAHCLIGHMIALKSMERMPNTDQIRQDYHRLAILPLLAGILDTDT